MVNLSAEQKNFIQELSDWASSEDCKQTAFNRVCSALHSLINKKRRANELPRMNILLEELTEEKEKVANGSKYSITEHIIEYIHRSIERSYESDFGGSTLLKLINDVSAAKEYLITSNIKWVIPSDFSLDMKIENRQKVQRLDILISTLDEWIANPSNFVNYSNRKIQAIQSKYQKYKKDYHKHRSICSVSVLSNYIDKPEDAKAFLSEIFTKRQESFYSKLEDWTKSLDDQNCGNWLRSFLDKGRDLRIRSITVLRYIDNEDKAKEFLLSKYKVKLNWDKKKKEKRERKHNSIFDKYDDYKNSLSHFISEVSRDTKLYSKCLSTNVSGGIVSSFTLMSYKDGIEIWKDSIRLGIVVYHLSLRSTNQLFYEYSSTYRKYTRTFTFFSPYALEIIKDYCSSFLDKGLLVHTKGCVIIREYESNHSVKCYTSLLTDDVSYFCNEPLFLYKFVPTSGVFYHDIAGYRFVFKALIWHLLKDKTDAIDFSADRDFTQKERKLIFALINKTYDSMSFEDQYICHFIDTEKYKFPDDDIKKQAFREKSLRDRIINLKHCITCQYDSQLLEDMYFPFAKVWYEYGDKNFRSLVEAVGSSINSGKFLHFWFDESSVDFLTNLRVLTFVNWAYVSNSTGNVKKITACWLLYIIFNQYKNSFERDKNFWTLLLAYTLIENETIFASLIGKLNESNREDGLGIASVIRTLTKDISQLKKKLTFDQKCYFSDNMYNCTLFEEYHKCNKETKTIDLIDAEKTIKKLCDLIEKNNGLFKNYSEQSILELLENVPKFDRPSNFTYESNHSSGYDRYNGDYRGTYAHDVMGYSNSDIDTIFDGDPDAYWNID